MAIFQSQIDLIILLLFVQSQIETQRATLKYERACSVHQAAKKMLAMAEQKLVSTSKEHKVLDPSWQEMLNQAVFKV